MSFSNFILNTNRISTERINREILKNLYLYYYSTLLRLSPLRFHCVGGCDIEPRTVATLVRIEHSFLDLPKNTYLVIQSPAEET